MVSRDARDETIRKTLADIKKELSQRKASMKCSEACEILISLGFEIRDGKKGGHKIYVHDHLPSFMSSSLDCGHGRDPVIKPAYIQKVIKVLALHEEELVEYMHTLQER